MWGATDSVDVDVGWPQMLLRVEFFQFSEQLCFENCVLLEECEAVSQHLKPWVLITIQNMMSNVMQGVWRRGGRKGAARLWQSPNSFGSGRHYPYIERMYILAAFVTQGPGESDSSCLGFNLCDEISDIAHHKLILVDLSMCPTAWSVVPNWVQWNTPG